MGQWGRFGCVPVPQSPSGPNRNQLVRFMGARGCHGDAFDDRRSNRYLAHPVQHGKRIVCGALQVRAARNRDDAQQIDALWRLAQQPEQRRCVVHAEIGVHDQVELCFRRSAGHLHPSFVRRRTIRPRTADQRQQQLVLGGVGLFSIGLRQRCGRCKQEDQGNRKGSEQHAPQGTTQASSRHGFAPF